VYAAADTAAAEANELYSLRERAAVSEGARVWLRVWVAHAAAAGEVSWDAVDDAARDAFVHMQITALASPAAAATAATCLVYIAQGAYKRV
jgi:hypothetical protein